MKRDWKNFLLTLFFWVFAWTLIDTTFALLKLTPEQTILICVAGLVLTSSLITRLDWDKISVEDNKVKQRNGAKSTRESGKTNENIYNGIRSVHFVGVRHQTIAHLPTSMVTPSRSLAWTAQTNRQKCRWSKHKPNGFWSVEFYPCDARRCGIRLVSRDMSRPEGYGEWLRNARIQSLRGFVCVGVGLGNGREFELCGWSLSKKL